MTIYQLSIFIENRTGTLVKVLRILKQEGIQIVASTVADTADYGIYRLICSEPERACEKLREGGISVALSDVFALELDNEPGRASDAIETFEKAGISISYLPNRRYRKGQGGYPREQTPLHSRARPLETGLKESLPPAPK